VRAVSMADRRVAEAAKLGFKKIIIPTQGAESIRVKDIEILTVSTLDRALDLLF